MSSAKHGIKLETKLVGEVEGNFYVPSYQRGYRWGEAEVIRLLDDINSNGTKNYCLQPIVVRRREDSFELIDGQQRLTTLFLIYKFMNRASSGFLDEPKFSLIYETRTASEEFLAEIDQSRKEENIDFWFMANAYETIEEWFRSKDKKSMLTNINTYFDENVKIIWYEVDETQDAIALFTRLNIGKIPLTSAELVKAMFLSRDNNSEMSRERQEEISLQWDNIEKELQNNSLWYFLTNRSNAKYQTRIDLILDLLSEKEEDNKEKYFSFFYFDDRKNKKENLNEIWKEIQHTFLILKDWYEDHELYHKIGYLIASDTKSLKKVFDLSNGKKEGEVVTKTKFKFELDRDIKSSISIDKKNSENTNYSELSYEKSSDRISIYRLLLLFNVESVRQNDEESHWFPFDRFKSQKLGKGSWSLEHIHAQQSEGMPTQKQWKEWLELHIPSIEALGTENSELIDEMNRAIADDSLSGTDFEEIQPRVIQKLSLEQGVEYKHSIANLALLNMSDNAALNNSTFDVKRNTIIEMDKKGHYIPFCTKMVFLKYYTPSKDNQLHFWGQPDRDAYIAAINSTLKNYLEEEILIEKAAD